MILSYPDDHVAFTDLALGSEKSKQNKKNILLCLYQLKLLCNINSTHKYCGCDVTKFETVHSLLTMYKALVHAQIYPIY